MPIESLFHVMVLVNVWNHLKQVSKPSGISGRPPEPY